MPPDYFSFSRALRATFWLAVALSVVSFAGRVQAQETDASTPRLFLIEPATPHALGFRWYISGDSNRNATVAVRCRAAGDLSWRPALPLLRIGGEEVDSEGDAPFVTPQMFAGSILNLSPATDYTVELAMVDPDGGGATRTEQISTRRSSPPEPAGVVRRVYPSDHQGAREEPSYSDLQTAWNAALPGDTILLAPGLYQPAEENLKGRPAWKLSGGGTAEQPIVIEGAGPGTVLEGRGANDLVDLQAARHVWVRNLEFRGADYLLLIGRDTPASDITVTGCSFSDSSFPVMATHPGCTGLSITDNRFQGLRPNWHPRDTLNNDSHAVWIGGQGHEVSHNTISGYWDGIAIFGGPPPADLLLQNAAIDIHHNRISEISDDAIEMDYGVHNIRVHHNLISNVFAGVSAQPLYGGPGYIFRNVVYNSVRTPLKPNRQPAGLFVANNTLIAWGSAGRWTMGWQNSRFYNNLFFGTDGGPGVIWTGAADPTVSRMDFNGWRLFKSGERHAFWWKFARLVRIPTDAEFLAESPFDSWDLFRHYTQMELNGTVVDFDCFIRAEAPSGEDAPLPLLDLRLRSPGAPVDRGIPLPGITDDQTGAAPDLGAYELGSSFPIYGPRGRIIE